MRPRSDQRIQRKGVSHVELVERGCGIKDQESRLILDQTVAIGRGGVFLRLTEEQYARLRNS